MQRIISVTSGKGGVGKSNIALNLALYYSKITKTILFDGDLGLGNIETLLGVQVSKTLDNVLKNECAINDIIFNYKNLSIVSGGSGICEIADLEEIQRNQIMERLLGLNDFSVIIIDTSPGISKNVLQFLKISTDVIVITTPEITSLKDSYQLIKALYINSNKNYKQNIGIITNLASSKKQADSRAFILQNNSIKFLGLDVNYYGFINNHYAVKQAVENQIPFVIKDFYSLPSTQLKSIFFKVYKSNINNKEKKMLHRLFEKREIDVKEGDI